MHRIKDVERFDHEAICGSYIADEIACLRHKCYLPQYSVPPKVPPKNVVLTVPILLSSRQLLPVRRASVATSSLLSPSVKQSFIVAYGNRKHFQNLLPLVRSSIHKFQYNRP